MSRKSLKFVDKNINRNNFYKNKKLFKIDFTDVDKILISKKESYTQKEESFRYFVGYNDNNVIRLDP